METHPSNSQEDQFARLLAAHDEMLLHGKPTTTEGVAPELADRFGQARNFVELLNDIYRRDSKAKLGDRKPPETLGDFRVLEEIGRGGMGVVYRAEQISLARQVALKVLPFAATMDAKQILRFKNEAQVAALFHHTNIVPIYFVGQDKGVHFYAMQYIKGQSLLDVLKKVRSAAQNSHPIGREKVRSVPMPLLAESAADESSQPQISTLELSQGPEYFRKVAQLGIQAARALDHAHELGVIHRDVKPGNLLLDLHGNLWVADFGLAQIQGGGQLTLTGDLLGTLRYMSPEQALAHRVGVDHHTDIYSLGATLYELLSLQPVFEGINRQELLRQIAFDAPRALRRQNKTIPSELEIIVLKALEKSPADRYATAKEMAEDLERYVNAEPIRARKPSLKRMLGHLCRRHKLLVTASTVFIITALTLGTLVLFANERQRAIRQKEIALTAASSLEESHRWAKQGRWMEALAAANRAVNALGDEIGNDELRSQVLRSRTIFGLLVKIDDIRLEMAAPGPDGGPVDLALGDKLYTATFQDFGLDLDKLEPEEAARLLPNGPLADEFAGALDDWAVLRRTIRRRAKMADDRPWQRILDTARAVDPHPVHNRARDLWTQYDSKASEEMRKLPIEDLNPRSFRMFVQVGGSKFFLPSFQKRRPGDFWLNYMLGTNLTFTNSSAQMDEASGYLRAALAQRPDNANTLAYLGHSLLQGTNAEQKMAEGIACLERAILLRPDLDFAFQHLGNGLAKNGKIEEALAVFRKVIVNKPANPYYCFRQAELLKQLRRWDEAVAAYLEAIRVDGKAYNAYQDLAYIMERKGQYADAITYHQAALARMPPGDQARTPAQVAIKANLFYLDMEKRLPAILAGQDNAAAPDLFKTAVWCDERKQFATAAFVYQKALRVAHPQDKLALYRYLAACAAAQGGCGVGADAASFSDEQRSELRSQARNYFDAELKRLQPELRKKNIEKRLDALSFLQTWREQVHLNCIREPGLLAQLPAAEAQLWQQFWAGLPKVNELQFSGVLTKDVRSKVHEVSLKQGKTYVIDLSSKDFDTFLILESSKGALLRFNDDANTSTTNSRLIYQPAQTDSYRLKSGVVASDQRNGSYNLRIWELDDQP